jgi:hypothetical protein
MLLQGIVAPRPPKNRSQAHPGIHPLSALTHRTQRFEPLPTPLGDPPYHYNLETAVPGIGKRAAKAGKIIFHTVGDTGGIKHPESQQAVAAAMKADLNQPEARRPAFFYHLGDVVYYNGEHDQYYEQFYDPYNHYDAPILSIPGNHDGDPVDDSAVSLDGWVAYFMTATPHVDPESRDAERVTMSQPNVYFTLDCPFATIIGMYTNVPEHGSVDSVQQQWLTNEFATAPKDKALLCCLHHPVYSFDDHHSGSARMADVVQQAINDSRRVPNMVLTAHVHNYQRIERTILKGKATPFLVAGHGGYWNLHRIIPADGVTDPDTGAKLVVSERKRHGYVTLTIDADTISGSMTAVGKEEGNVTPDADTFEYPAAAQFLPDGVVVSL